MKIKIVKHSEYTIYQLLNDNGNPIKAASTTFIDFVRTLPIDQIDDKNLRILCHHRTKKIREQLSA